MFGFSFWEIAIVLVVALIILGPKKLPELARSLGKGIREFRKATDDFKSTMDYEMSRPEEERKQITPPVEEAELLPETPSEPAADEAVAARAEAQAKEAVEAARDSAAKAPKADAPSSSSASGDATTPVES